MARPPPTNKWQGAPEDLARVSTTPATSISVTALFGTAPLAMVALAIRPTAEPDGPAAAAALEGMAAASTTPESSNSSLAPSPSTAPVPAVLADLAITATTPLAVPAET